MDPVTVLTWAAVWAAVSVAGYVTVTFILLTLDEVINWFRKYISFRNPINTGKVAFTLANKLSNRDYNIIQGVFDRQSDGIVQYRVVEAKNVDETIQEAHSYGNKELALWQ